MATADDDRTEAHDFASECWNEICEDIECDDTNYHATVDELLERVRNSSADLAVIDEAEDIVLQAELSNEDDEDN